MTPDPILTNFWLRLRVQKNAESCPKSTPDLWSTPPFLRQWRIFSPADRKQKEADRWMLKSSPFFHLPCQGYTSGKEQTVYWAPKFGLPDSGGSSSQRKIAPHFSGAQCSSHNTHTHSKSSALGRWWSQLANRSSNASETHALYQATRFAVIQLRHTLYKLAEAQCEEYRGAFQPSSTDAFRPEFRRLFCTGLSALSAWWSHENSFLKNACYGHNDSGIVWNQEEN